MENTDIKILNEYYMKIKFHLDTRPLININNLSYKELIDLLFRIFSKISIHKKKPVVNIIDEVVFALCINQQGSGSYMPCRDIIDLRANNKNKEKMFLIGIHEYAEREFGLMEEPAVLRSLGYEVDSSGLPLDQAAAYKHTHMLALGIQILVAEKIKHDTNNREYVRKNNIMIIDNMKLCSVSNNSFAAKYIENNKKALEKYGFIF